MTNHETADAAQERNHASQGVKAVPELACAKVLAVDDDAEAVKIICMILTAEGHECVGATSGKEALTLCSSQRFDCMLLESTLGDTTAVALAHRLAQTPGVRPNHVILMTGYPRDDYRAELRNGLLDGYIQKPADLYELATVVARSLRRIH